MADYFAMNHDELTAEKAALEAQYKKFQDMGLKLNMARGKPGPHQMDLAMDLLKLDDYTAADGTDVRNYGNLEGLEEARELFADVFGVKANEVFVGGNSSRDRHDVRLSGFAQAVESGREPQVPLPGARL